MATLNISQFSGATMLPGSVLIPVLTLPPIGVETLTFTTSAPSAALDAGCTLLRLVADADCYILMGTGTPVASPSNGVRLTAKAEYIFAIGAMKGTLKVAAVAV